MSSDTQDFKNLLKLSKHFLVITGAGISAESGIPTFRGGPALSWRGYISSDLANLQAFKKNPSLVWEFYHFRREICLKAQPNAAHLALSKFESLCNKENKQFNLITQNVDGLHRRAGSKNIISIHGELFETKCMSCETVKENYDSPICEGLRDRGNPAAGSYSDIPIDNLPRCDQCHGLLRPNVVWFGENLRSDDLDKAYHLIDECDLCLVIGTSAVVNPVASFPVQVSERGVAVAEFNTEHTAISSYMKFGFYGPSAEIIPPLLE